MHSKESGKQTEGEERLKELYPFVDETKTPLPRAWSPTDKCGFLGISHNSLRVTYRGQGKNHKDAAAVRSSHPIPTTCGIYYYEVKIISKGRDGYMGIGVCAKEVSMNRLPGWERASYGYHGDDGNSFCSSGSGVSYGPTFTTGDVIGCGLNLVDHTSFYTKNGQNLGIAFTDLPDELYPSVGLQTPGEIVDTNFGQQPFLYDIMEDIKEAQLRVFTSIERFSLPVTKKEWFDKLISSYLVHHGYCASAESFNEATAQSAPENAASMKNRQLIQRLVLNGRISETMQTVNQIYPGLLERRPRLEFLLKCRQFIEMVAGMDDKKSPKGSSTVSPAGSPPHKSSVVKSLSSPHASPRDSPRRIRSPRSRGSPACPGPSADCEESNHHHSHFENGSSSIARAEGGENSETPMDLCVTNGASTSARHYPSLEEDSDSVLNGASEDVIDGEENGRGSSRCVVLGGEGGVEALLRFGRDLRQMSSKLKNASKQIKIMNDAFSLLAYPNPWESRVSYLLLPNQREPVAAALNSAILEEQGYSGKPALETLCIHAKRLRDQMATSGIGASAFADPSAHLLPPAPSSPASLHTPPSHSLMEICTDR